MGRPSNRQTRRAEIVDAFARVLADHGYAGATIAAVAAEAGLAPGLLHHHFRDKSEIMEALADRLLSGFELRVKRSAPDESAACDPVARYLDAALALDERSDRVAARCWVGLFAQALASPPLFKRIRRQVDSEILRLRRWAPELSDRDAGALLAFVVGSLVLGAFAPRKTAGFAAPSAHRLLRALGGGQTARS